jgi:Peptidase S46
MPKKRSCSKAAVRMQVSAAMSFRCTTVASTICTATSATPTCAWCLRRNLPSHSSAAIRTISIFRALTSISVSCDYENDKPASSPEYLRWSANGSKDGDLVFVSGNPGRTSRELTVAQLEYLRDTGFPFIIPQTAEYRGQLEQFVNRGPEQAREAKEDLLMRASQVASRRQPSQAASLH